MVATPSTMLELGTQAPSFCLPDPKSGNEVIFDHRLQKKGYLIAFICNHCPYVLHLLPRLSQLSNRWAEQGVQVYFISSNDVENYPADSPELMKELAIQYDFRFPYLFDEEQTVAHAYQAACTPDFFLFDSSYSLFYRGQFDSSRPHNEQEVNGEDLAYAVNQLLADSEPPINQKPSLGCNLKWKKGNEPQYFVPKK
jgi:peroxiredoxin